MKETNHFVILNGNNESLATSDISSVDKNFQAREMEAGISLNTSNADILFEENWCKT
jgi:hypothetical protein